MTPPLIKHLVQFGDTHVTIASNLVDDAKRLCEISPDHLSAAYLDIANQEELEKLIGAHDHVISFIPPWMHTPVAAATLKMGKNMTTSSYSSPDMMKMDDEVKSKGLVFLNECGLDPGIDILGTMKIVHQAEKAGLKITSYESYCGGLPAAENADNPLGYKFSWNPGAAIRASRNPAIFMKNGKREEQPNCLKCVEQRDDFSVSMKFETYPNRDSTAFMEKFGMQDCETFIRGTIRYTGFCWVISAFHDLAVTSDEPFEGEGSFKDFLTAKVAAAEKKSNSVMGEKFDKHIDVVTEGFSQADATLIRDLLHKVDFSYVKCADETVKAMNNIVKTLKFLDFFDDNNKIKAKTDDGKARSALDILGDLMVKKLAMADNDRDLIAMRHIFKIHDPKDGESWEHTSTMVVTGDSKASGNQSMMAITVGVTCGIATRMVLEGEVKKTGVLSPITPEIYEPILKELEKKGIFMVDESSSDKGLKKMQGLE
eukprot:CAMPEP_0170491436 /NCGR_PEP_ID=MMETSP0208-20121228/11005_1 /TAXON_ID=197538 /ORGANISM="Strombidium inclinatum, Strain S3" /LENGTH=483 /DNA_ID=CAMNT_0010767009 /DNA_START=62 /DNA_END=1511 /DNA_ORIENTATION=+